MAAPTYRARSIVLRKTKLGESDLIVTLLAEDGSQLRAVAKGARKPTSSFSSRLELYAVADVMLARGKSLDIVKEARLAAGNEALRFDIARATAAAPVAELLDRVSQQGLESPKLFALTEAALAAINDAPAALAPALAAACLLKACAFAGVRPSLNACAACGGPLEGAAIDGMVPVSYAEGGLVCDGCRRDTNASYIEENAAAWARVLMASTFAQIRETDIPVAAAFSVLSFCQQYVRVHVGSPLKSLEFLFTCGIDYDGE